MATEADLLILQSGGGNNRLGDRSLGGPYSEFEVPQRPQNNLFDNVAPQDALAGLTDYRCIYLYNNAQVGTMHDITLQVENKDMMAMESVAAIGMQNPTDEVQEIVIQGKSDDKELKPFVILESFTGVPFMAFDLGDLAATIQSGLRTCPYHEEVVVSQTKDDGKVRHIEVSFIGLVGNRANPLLKLVKNQLHQGGGTLVQIAKKVEGGPINVEASVIPTDITMPSHVKFDTKISVSLLMPQDFVPIWVERKTHPHAHAEKDTGFTLMIEGKVDQGLE